MLIDDCLRRYKNANSIPKYVFYMGMGEPTLLSERLVIASDIICNKYPDLSFKISTMGAVPKAIVEFAKIKHPLRSLQLSMPHWDNDRLKYLFANCVNYNSRAVLEALKEFSNLRPQAKIKLNYIPIKGYNDQLGDLEKTINLVRRYLRKNFQLKISCLNPTNISRKNGLMPVPKQKLKSFLELARNLGVKKAYIFGPVINPEKKIGCGQLAGDYANPETF